ncbi:MAG: hypothetical protein M0T80_01855 [Actinomycetota bacterium]|nr:hypothetical protein [Actinomycetota bacterium]
MLATLLEAARPGQRRPDRGEAASLVAHGLALRVGLDADGLLGGLLAAAASPALASAAVASLVVLCLGELGLGKLGPVPPGAGVVGAHFGPFLTIGPFAYLATVVLLVATAAASASGPSPSWELTRAAFYQGSTAVLAAWAPAAGVAAVTVAAACATLHPHRLAATLVVWSVPWLIVSIAHAPRQSTEVVSAALLAALVVALAAASIERAAHPRLSSLDQHAGALRNRPR